MLLQYHDTSLEMALLVWPYTGGKIFDSLRFQPLNLM